MTAPIRFGAIGIDHRHVIGQAAHMQAVGGVFKAWWTQGEPGPMAELRQRFPHVPRVADRRALLEDPAIDLILIAAIPDQRADLAIEAMRHGKDVMLDKPGCTTLAQLDKIKQVVEETGRLWSVDFSERFEVPAVTRAAELVAQGAIGRVLQTVGLGPHRIAKPSRPDWFFQGRRTGGILADIGAHQIDQFLFFTGASDAEITLARVANLANPDVPALHDFGEMALTAPEGSGYIRVDWFTPDALPTWGDGRLMLLGTDGTLEIRKYCDIGFGDGRRTDSLYLVNRTRCEVIDARDADLPYFPRLAEDIRNRTETAMPQAHAFKVMELALKAQAMAETALGG